MVNLDLNFTKAMQRIQAAICHMSSCQIRNSTFDQVILGEPSQMSSSLFAVGEALKSVFPAALQAIMSHAGGGISRGLEDGWT